MASQAQSIGDTGAAQEKAKFIMCSRSRETVCVEGGEVHMRGSTREVGSTKQGEAESEWVRGRTQE